ncbi:MAG: hypothetical protein QXJ68_02105 [Methanocellales archaeon]
MIELLKLNAKVSLAYVLNLLFLIAAAVFSFELTRILLVNINLDEKIIHLALIPIAILIFSLIFLATRKSMSKDAFDSNAIRGIVSEISEIKGKNGLTYFKIKINNQIYEVPLLPETYYLVNTHKGERISIPLTPDLRRYLKIINNAQ